MVVETANPLHSDPVVRGYAVGLAASFGISHVTPVHNFLTVRFPRTYPYLNVVLPCGRAIFLLLILERGARLSDAREQHIREGRG